MELVQIHTADHRMLLELQKAWIRKIGRVHTPDQQVGSKAVDRRSAYRS